MTTLFRSAGDSVEYTNAGAAISTGGVVKIGTHTLGVAATDIAASTGVGTVHVEGIFVLPKVTTAVIAQGEYVIWDTSAGKFDDDQATPASGDVSTAAFAVAAAGNGATTVRVKLCPGNGTTT